MATTAGSGARKSSAISPDAKLSSAIDGIDTWNSWQINTQASIATFLAAGPNEIGASGAVIIGKNGNDDLDGGPADDVLIGRKGDDKLNGDGGNDLLLGGDGDDFLDGGEGKDLLVGSKGNDVYIVDSIHDVVVELIPNSKGGGDSDEVRSSVGFSLAQLPNVENLTLTGNGDISGIGNASNNVITGNEGDNKLEGAAGNDRIRGNGGNDLLVGGRGNDEIDGGNGQDTAFFSGKFAEYAIANVSGVITIKDNVTSNGNDGTDTLTSVEFLQFQDGKFPSPTVISTIDLASLDGINGFRLIGIDEGDRSGFSVSTAGDVNGDGFDDVIVGAPYAESPGAAYNEGESYVVFGKASWAGTPSLDLATLDGTNGFRLIGIDVEDQSGRSVSSAGDVNGDGFDDVIIGAFFAESAGGDNNEGESYVVFGKTSWAGTPSLDLEALDGTNGFRLIGDMTDLSGASVSTAGDVNGDGFADLIVGAPNGGADYESYAEGESFMVFGKASWAGTPSLDLGTLDGTNGVRLMGLNEGDANGSSVSSAGDVNGDGFDDLIVGSPTATTEGGFYAEGESYVVFGKASWAGTPSLELGTLDGTNGFRLIGIDTYDHSGHSVSSAGDVNGDGFADLIVGAPFAESAGGADDEGESYVVFGKASWVGTPSLDLAMLDGTNGVRLIGIDTFDESGRSVSSAGDVNGDGFDDLIVGAPLAGVVGETSGEGGSYVVFGKASWAGTPSLDFATLDGTNGFRLIGIVRSGWSVSSAGDVNGDGFADLIVGAPYAQSAEGANSEGESYVVFGGNFTGAVTHLGGTGDDTLTGKAAAETFVGGTGNDTLIGGGGADAFQGGAGDDTIGVSTLDFFRVDGGNGVDTLELDGSGLHLDLTGLADNRTQSIERIDIEGTGDNTLTLSVIDVLNLSEESNELLLLGNAGDVVSQGAGWTTATTGGTNGDGTSTIDGETYQIHIAGQATLLVDTDMTVSV